MSNNPTPETSESTPYFQSNICSIEEYDKNIILSISQLLEERIKKNKRKKFKVLKDNFFTEIIPKITIYLPDDKSNPLIDKIYFHLPYLDLKLIHLLNFPSYSHCCYHLE